MNKIVVREIPEKILIIKPSSLGDIVHSLPFLQVIRNSFPSAEIHWVVAKGFEGLLKDHPMINKLLIIKKDQWRKPANIGKTIVEVRRFFREIRKESYDVAIDLQGLLRSGLIIYATKAPIRVGFEDAREGGDLFYTHKVKTGKEMHAVNKYLEIASAMGLKAGRVEFPMPLIGDALKKPRLKGGDKEYIVVVPGARWRTKRWSAEKFGALISMLETETIIVGAGSDTKMSEEIKAKSNGNALSMAGKTDIKELILIIRNAEYVICNDSGPMHIAAALNIPVIAIFGPTNPLRTGPYGSNHVIIRRDIDCAPCYKKTCKDIKCMEDISVETVYKAIAQKGFAGQAGVTLRA